MLPLFIFAIFLSAALLFLVEPMVARLVLPMLGGSPSVWTTCMLFFQAALLAGYGYSHLLTTRLKPRWQAVVHIMVLAAACVSLPLAVPRGWTAPPEGIAPALWLLGLLGVTVGLPFFVVSTTGPLLQHWFSRIGHARSADPYFLYGASNIGSAVGLLGYPLVVERVWSLHGQGALWAIGYGLLAAGLIACAIGVLRAGKIVPAPPVAPLVAETVQPARARKPAAAHASAPPTPRIAPITWRRRGVWTLLALIPSSLTLGVTQYMTTDVAAVPLLWVIPLVIYLMTFVVAFSPRVRLPLRALSLAMSLLALVIGTFMALGVHTPIAPLIALHLVGLAAASLLCHGTLAADRPGAANLTEFYFFLALGGVLGGCFNALLAPVIFSSVLEYPIMLAAACLPHAGGADDKPRSMLRLLAWPLAVILLMTGLQLILSEPSTAKMVNGIFGQGFAAQNIGPVRTIAAALVCAWALWKAARIESFVVSLLALVVIGQYLQRTDYGMVVHAERTFFGVHVVHDDGNEWFTLHHGTTQHGMQSHHVDTVTGRSWGLDPRTYFSRTGPIGDVFRCLQPVPGKVDRVAVIGLGAGSLAAYARPGDTCDFFEIDKAVIGIATEPAYFTFVKDARDRGAKVNMILGDGRLSIARAEGGYGLIIIDAFSSDVIPVHLITREAIEIYRSRLAPGGVIAFHISNRYFDLRPVLAEIGASLKMATSIRQEDRLSPADIAQAKKESWWAVMSNAPADLGTLVSAPDWHALPPSGSRLWTDDHADVFSVFHPMGLRSAYLAK